MRRSCFAVFMLIAVVTTGCRQTTSPSATNPLTPIGPLAPIGGSSATGTGSAFGPLGAPTRVTPPSSGAFGVPNNYMGGVVPIGQAAAPNGAPGGFAASAPGIQNQVIGSGVQAAGWTETGTNVQPAGGSFSAGNEISNTEATAQNPRLGGMRVIDLTGAPAPPGYRPANPLPSAPQPIGPGAGFESNLQPLNQPFVPSPGFNNTPTPGFRTIQSPSGGDFAGSQNGWAPSTQQPAAGGFQNQTPVTIARSPEVPLSPSPMAPSFRGREQFPVAPSTDPTSNNSFKAQPRDLQWRAPARY